jgi:hypothetical protein
MGDAPSCDGFRFRVNPMNSGPPGADKLALGNAVRR